MKRSKMISLIGNLHPFRMMPMDEALPLIEDLLSQIEQAGMRPTTGKQKVKGHIGTIPEYKFWLEVTEWEEE